MVGHVGSRLLADLADANGLTTAFTNVLRRLRPRSTGHAPGGIAVDLVVMPADGGQTIADPAVPRDQPAVFSPVAPTPTAWAPLAHDGSGLPRGDRSQPTRSSARAHHEAPWELELAEVMTKHVPRRVERRRQGEVVRRRGGRDHHRQLWCRK
ncbi:hypothetical protein ACFWOJ_32430 [Streptomyces sp. NPDC058439]|uniref:hypothetical protein n=1 Tax=Streptomyces sp. NPDC058439 TaxID=3346500 RepID=UPI003657641D